MLGRYSICIYRNTMRHIRYLITGIFVISGLAVNQVTDSDYETQLLNEIFIELTEKLQIGKILSPPPPSPIFDNNHKIVGYDSTNYLVDLKKYKEDIRNSKLDTSKYILAINDSLFSYSDDQFDLIRNNLPSGKYIDAWNSFRENKKKSTWIDLNKFNNTGKFRLFLISDLLKGNDIWEKMALDSKISGIIHISRIHFSKNKNYGIFYCSITCGRLCGHGYAICIERINDQWKIEKTIELWIS